MNPKTAKFSIPLFHSLRFRILAMVIGFVLVSTVLLSLYVVRQFQSLYESNIVHEGVLFGNALEAGVIEHAARGNEAAIQEFLDRFVAIRERNDVEINILLLRGDTSFIVASNNPSNIEQTDDEEHEALLASIASRRPVVEIESNSFDVDPDDDLSQMFDPQHPDYYFPPGTRVSSITTPLIDEGKGVGSINIEFSLSHLDQRLESIYRHLLLTLAVGVVVLSLAIAVFLNAYFLRPIWNIAEDIVQFGKGKLKQVRGTVRSDEIGILTLEFSRMVSRIKQAESLNIKYQNQLEKLVDERTRELLITQDVTIEAMGALAETRDPETGGHIKRTQNYVKLLAGHLCRNPKYSDVLDDDTIELFYKSAPLHDIGKVGISDDILLKPGKLTEEEFEIMKYHTIYGRDALLRAEEKLGTNSFLRYAREIAYTHQEKWDGSGYPQGLSGNHIPLSGRIMAVADVYDALISKRCYKPPFTHEKAVAIIREERGKHFDPDIVDAFLELEVTFKAIALRYADYSEEREALES
ncbi:MAG: HD domain-containing phosphohydrolase [Candidatus Thiodiazotropha sp.]